jgi:hypothetical protein
VNGFGARQKEGDGATLCNVKDFLRDKGLVKASAADLLSSFALLWSQISSTSIKCQPASRREEKQSGRLSEVKCHLPANSIARISLHLRQSAQAIIKKK